MIKPTVGRVVWLHRQENKTGQPEVALIVYVHTDECINVVAWNCNGEQFVKTSVPLDQEGLGKPEWASMYAEWMPYQKGQAAKTEALEAQLGS